MSIPKPTRNNTYIYSRVSGNQTRLNDNDPTSPFISSDYQISRCMTYANNNLSINGPSVFIENKPSYSTEMSQQETLFQLLKDEKIHLIFLRVDRFSRCFQKAFEIIDKIIPAKNITLHFVEENIQYNKDSTQGVRQLLVEALMKAHNESHNLSRRLKDINAHKKRLGNELGSAPYGMKIVNVNNIRKKIVNEEESNMIEFIKKIYDIKEFNNNKSISFRVLNSTLMKLTDDEEIKKRIKDDPIHIWDSKVTIDEQKLTKGFDAEDVAFILNDKGFRKRGKEWTKNAISSIISNARSKKRKINTNTETQTTQIVDNNQYIDGLRKRRNKSNITFQGNYGQASQLIQNQVTYNMNNMTM